MQPQSQPPSTSTSSHILSRHLAQAPIPLAPSLTTTHTGARSSRRGLSSAIDLTSSTHAANAATSTSTLPAFAHGIFESNTRNGTGNGDGDGTARRRAYVPPGMLAQANMRKTTATTTPYEVHPTFRPDADRPGDVLLRVGTGYHHQNDGLGGDSPHRPVSPSSSPDQMVEFLCHRDVLWFASPFFRSVLQGDWKETSVGQGYACYEDGSSYYDSAGEDSQDGDGNPDHDGHSSFETESESGSDGESTSNHQRAIDAKEGVNDPTSTPRRRIADLATPPLLSPSDHRPPPLLAGTRCQSQAIHRQQRQERRNSRSSTSTRASVSRLVSRPTRRKRGLPQSMGKGRRALANKKEKGKQKQRTRSTRTDTGVDVASAVLRLGEKVTKAAAAYRDGVSQSTAIEDPDPRRRAPVDSYQSQQHHSQSSHRERHQTHRRHHHDSRRHRRRPLLAVIDLPAEDAATLEAALLHVYPHLELTVTWRNCSSLLQFADKFDVAGLRNVCVSFLRCSLAGRPILALKIADDAKLKDVYRESSRHVLDNMPQWEPQELVVLSAETLLKLERKRTWFLERLLKLGLAQPGRDFLCQSNCPDPDQCAKLLQERWTHAMAAAFRFGPPTPSLVWRHLRELESGVTGGGGASMGFGMGWSAGGCGGGGSVLDNSNSAMGSASHAASAAAAMGYVGGGGSGGTAGGSVGGGVVVGAAGGGHGGSLGGYSGLSSLGQGGNINNNHHAGGGNGSGTSNNTNTNGNTNGNGNGNGNAYYGSGYGSSYNFSWGNGYGIMPQYSSTSTFSTGTGTGTGGLSGNGNGNGNVLGQVGSRELAACHNAAKAWVQLLFDRMFNLPSGLGPGRGNPKFLTIKLD